MMVNGKVEYNCSGLKRLIDGYEAVSFDIFDTLVMRKVYFNHDVFLLVAEKYAEKVPDYFNVRIKAEQELSETRYPYIEEIYDYVARECNVSNELKTEIMNTELDLERSVIIARETVVDIFNYCKTIGKKLYIISDMYMHRRELEEIINKAGIVKYDGIFISCEYGTSKTQRLFECYKNEVKAKSYLHVGDNFLCDIEAPSKVGIDGFRLKTSAEILESLGGVASEDFKERCRQAEYISIKYNNPFYGGQ